MAGYVVLEKAVVAAADHGLAVGGGSTWSALFVPGENGAEEDPRKESGCMGRAMFFQRRFSATVCRPLLLYGLRFTDGE